MTIQTYTCILSFYGIFFTNMAEMNSILYVAYIWQFNVIYKNAQIPPESFCQH